MNEKFTNEQLLEILRNQLAIARSEIKNLRNQVVNLKHNQQKAIEDIDKVLKGVKCDSCKNKSESSQCGCEFPEFKSIGVIESWFPEKRGIPRQGTLCTSAEGVLILHPSVINNPEYALSGLEEFSHLWIIYHFHKTDSNHTKTKVAPPRLNGSKVGVFSTRSPHRPCPLGLSVVKIEKICDNKIYFTGVDMLTGTPVLDIKPYIPQYDNPSFVSQSTEQEVESGSCDDKPPQTLPEFRSAPDGEEENVQVPSWISNSPNAKLKVEFTKRGLSQLNSLSQSEELKKALVNIIKEDPRSVYLKQKLGSQFYTFLIKDVHVTCKFDNANDSVVIYQVQKANENCKCGVPMWQCNEHGGGSGSVGDLCP